jgi:hypothetical protein
MYHQGLGVPKDEAQAIVWWLNSARQGYAKSEAELAFAYGSGRGVARDDAQSAAWCRKAAVQGLPIAQYNLGLLYSKGRGVEKDDTESYMWISLAAAQKFKPAVDALPQIGRILTPDQINEAKRRVAEWKPTPESNPKW